MKLSVAAAAIAFSGTALMFAPAAASAAPVQAKPQAGAKAGFDGGDFAKTGTADKSSSKAGASDKTGMSTAKLETASYDGMGGAFEEVPTKGSDDLAAKSGMGGEAKLQTASKDVGGKTGSDDGAGEAKFASADMDGGDGKLAMTGKPGLEGDARLASKQSSDRDRSQPVEADVVSKEATASAAGHGKETYAGMGGPEEATTEYPPCSPGPGDDRCIQLYEAGVSAKA